MAFESIEIGSATGSYSLSAGTYTVDASGGGGITGTNDGQYFVYQPVTGNCELIANVATQSGTNAYACAGLMFSDLSATYPASSQCAMIGVSPENGINFWWRTADDTVAQMTLGPSLTVPVWLRLVVNQSNVQGFFSTDGIEWVLVGECTLTFPTNFYSGMAAYSNVSGTPNITTFSGLYQLTNVPQLNTSLLPNWTNVEIGVCTGSFTANVDSSYTISSNGTGIIGGSDSLGFAYQPATSNAEISAYFSSMTSTEEFAFGGLMISDLSPTYPQSSQMVAILATYSYYSQIFWRLTDGTYAAGITGPAVYVPCWFKIAVLNGIVTVYKSTDGINWTGEQSIAITLPEIFYIGFIAGNTVTAQNVVTIGSASANLNAFMICWLRSDAYVTYASSKVSSWLDQSGHGYNATQTNSANQPSLVTGAINGLPAVSFNGSSSFMQFPTGFNNFSQGLSIFLVVKPAATTALSQILNLGTGSSNDYNLGIEINSSTEAEYFGYTGAGSGMTSVSYGSAITATAQLIEVIQTGTTATILTDGANPVTNSSMNTIPEPTTGRTNSYLGQASGGGNFFNGEIAEVIIFNTALSTAQRESVEDYLTNKFNL